MTDSTRDLTRDYLVIHECTTPYDEYVEWEVVPKVASPADAVAVAGFKVSRNHEDHSLVVFTLASDTAETRFTAREQVTLAWEASP